MDAMRKWLGALLLGLLAGMTVCVPQAQASEHWVRYNAPDYGFSMLVPAGTRLIERQQFGGWGELWARHDGVRLFAMIKRGKQVDRDELERLGVRLTGIPGDDWTTIGSGRDVAGFHWYRTVEAVRGNRLILGDYGTGRMGSYLLVLRTTRRDFQRYNADYRTWYQSIRLY